MAGKKEKKLSSLKDGESSKTGNAQWRFFKNINSQKGEVGNNKRVALTEIPL